MQKLEFWLRRCSAPPTSSSKNHTLLSSCHYYKFHKNSDFRSQGIPLSDKRPPHKFSFNELKFAPYFIPPTYASQEPGKNISFPHFL